MKLKKKLAQPFCRELGVPPASSRPGATHSCRLQGAWQAPFPFPCLTHWHPAFLHTFFFRLYCKKLAQSAPFCSVAVHCPVRASHSLIILAPLPLASGWRPMTNDRVNLACTLVGATVGLALSLGG